jgi:hypothetical protein
MALFEEFLNPILHNAKYSVLPLAGDASSRRYYRIVTEESAWVLMEWEPFENVSDFPFLSVQQYFDKNNIRVPKVYHFDQKVGLFLLEDLGDLTLERRFWEFQNQESILPFYEKTLDELIKIHSLSFKGDPKSSCTAYNIEFSVEKLMWELNYTKKHLLKDFLQLDFNEDELGSCFSHIAQELYKSPQVICHRDFHSRNVMLRYDQVVIIDFQDARLGPPAYDLVSLFYDSYVELNQPSVDYLMNYYIKNFPHYDKLNLDAEKFKYYFDIQTIQRCFKACGSFSSFKNMRDDNRYLNYIPTTLNRVSDLLKNYPNYKCLLDILESSREKWEQI